MSVIAANTFAETACTYWIKTVNKFREKRNMVVEMESEHTEEGSGYQKKLDFLKE